MIPDPEILSEAPQKTGDAAERSSSGWDIRNARRNYISLMAYQAGSAFFSFGAVWIITHYLGSEGYGGIVAMIAASQVAQILVNWTYMAVVRFGVEEFVDTQKIARAFWVRLTILVLNLALALVSSSLWFPPLAAWLRLSPDTFWFIIAHFTVTALWLHVQMGLQGVKLARTQGLLQLLERLIIFIGLVLLIGAKNLTVTTGLICYILGPALMIVVGTGFLRTYIFSRFAVDRVFLRKLFAYSLPLVPISFVGYLSGKDLDAIFISKFLSTRDLGIYSVATQITAIALQIPTLANQLLIPLFISLEKESQTHRTKQIFDDVLPTVVLIWSFLCTIGAACAAFLVPLVFGPEFTQAIVPLWILLAATAISLPVFFGYSALSHALSATYISLFAATLAGIANVVFNFVLIPPFGMAGCAWATALTMLAGTLAYALMLRRQTAISFSWTYFAMFPAIAGAVGLTIGGGVLFSLLLCVGLVFLVAFWKRHALSRSVKLLSNFTK